MSTLIVFEDLPLFIGPTRNYFPKLGQLMVSTPYVLEHNSPFPPEDSFSSTIPKEETEFVRGIVNTLGVMKAGVSAYQIRVTISPAYTWEEVQPELMRRISDRFMLESIELVEK
jgi:glycogen synthase